MLLRCILNLKPKTLGTTVTSTEEDRVGPSTVPPGAHANEDANHAASQLTRDLCPLRHNSGNPRQGHMYRTSQAERDSHQHGHNHQSCKAGA